ncbi:Translation initiation factor 2 subunit alpha [Candidatus Tiddalikarchaeum anstoanum]|nr:Translation initiation factor 2 subunit alpha [Candidatus Tiddalikarchaeum anstoanum]
MVFYKLSGLPAKGDIVLCKIKKILPHSAFAQLIEYDNLEGMIHISEVSSKWTRDISDVLSVDKQVVCRIENVDEQKGFIDLSIKRVSAGDAKKKKDASQNENRIEKVIEHACHLSKIKLEDFYKKDGFNIVEKYGSLQGFFEAFTEDTKIIDELSLPKTFKEHLIEAFNALLQKNRVNVNKRVKFMAIGPLGVDNIKTFIIELIKKSKEDDNSFQIKYIDAPEYLVSINSKDYKELDSYFNRVLSLMKNLAVKYDIKIL